MKIVVGSRESRLAVVQSMTVVDFLKSKHPGMDVELLTMKTTGDRILDRTLDKVGAGEIEVWVKMPITRDWTERPRRALL